MMGFQGAITGAVLAGTARGGGSAEARALAHGAPVDLVAAGQGAHGQAFLPLVMTDLV